MKQLDTKQPVYFVPRFFICCWSWTRSSGPTGSISAADAEMKQTRQYPSRSPDLILQPVFQFARSACLLALYAVDIRPTIAGRWPVNEFFGPAADLDYGCVSSGLMRMLRDERLLADEVTYDLHFTIATLTKAKNFSTLFRIPRYIDFYANTYRLLPLLRSTERNI